MLCAVCCVICDVQGIKVVLGDSSSEGSSDSRGGSTYTARVVGTDALHDLAVLQVRDRASGWRVLVTHGRSRHSKCGIIHWGNTE